MMMIDDFIHTILSVPFCPIPFLFIYHFVLTIVFVLFCQLPFCPRTDGGEYLLPGQTGRSVRQDAHCHRYCVISTLRCLSEKQLRICQRVIRVGGRWISRALRFAFDQLMKARSQVKTNLAYICGWNSTIHITGNDE